MSLSIRNEIIQAEPANLSRKISFRSTLLLLTMGAFATLVQAGLRFPLHIPGHQGLIWMAILVYARMNSSYRFSAVICSVGAASVSPFLGFHDPFAAFSFILSGLALDLGFITFAPKRLGMVALIGAVVFLAQPLLQSLIMSTPNALFHTANFGLPYLLLTHLAFGFTGSLIGLGLAKTRRINCN